MIIVRTKRRRINNIISIIIALVLLIILNIVYSFISLSDSRYINSLDELKLEFGEALYPYNLSDITIELFYNKPVNLKKIRPNSYDNKAYGYRIISNDITIIAIRRTIDLPLVSYTIEDIDIYNLKNKLFFNYSMHHYSVTVLSGDIGYGIDIIEDMLLDK